MDSKEFKKYLQSVRSSGIEAAKKLEIEYLNKQKQYFDKHGTLPPDMDGNTPMGWGTAQNIPQDDAMWIIDHNRFPNMQQDGFQYDALHIFSVEHSVESGAYMKIIDPDNLIIGDRYSQHQKWHNNDWKTRTTFVRMENGKIITSINRKAMIEYLNSLLG